MTEFVSAVSRYCGVLLTVTAEICRSSRCLCLQSVLTTDAAEDGSEHARRRQTFFTLLHTSFMHVWERFGCSGSELAHSSVWSKPSDWLVWMNFSKFVFKLDQKFNTCVIIPFIYIICQNFFWDNQSTINSSYCDGRAVRDTAVIDVGGASELHSMMLHCEYFLQKREGSSIFSHDLLHLVQTKNRHIDPSIVGWSILRFP